MKHALIFHGTRGRTDGNWFPWLKDELEKQGYVVAIPQFPTPEGQSLKSWLALLENYKDFIRKDSVLIGHSLGGLFLLRVLERLDQPVRAAFFIAAPVGVRPILYYDTDLAFSGFDFNWKLIRTKAKHFEVFHSNNDPYISLPNGEKLAEKLGVELRLIKNAGHINAESGYTDFPPLLEKILAL